MFDARSLFEQMMKGANPQQQGGGLSDISDLLRQFTQQQGGSRQQPQSGGRGATSSDSGAGSAFDDLLRQFTQGQDASSSSKSDGGSGSTGGASALEELMRQLQGRSGGADDNSGMRELPQSNEASDWSARRVSDKPISGQDTGGGQSSGGGLGDILGQVFGQGGESGDQKTAGQSPAQAPNLKDLLEKMGGSAGASGDIVRQLTDFISKNKVGAGVALGGLGALIFGTRTGRSLAMGAAKLGALAVVGGLAYKAYQNYSQGRPPVSGSIEPEAAPAGTGFEAENVSNDAAVTYIRGMIAAAGADGRISAEEQEQVINTLSQQGIDSGAEEFLARELNNPASIDDLVNGVSSDTERLQLYTAARVSIEPDTTAEQQFLMVLADRLGIAPDLRAHIDAAARGMV